MTFYTFLSLPNSSYYQQPLQGHHSSIAVRAQDLIKPFRHLTIEETYELSDAILEGDLEEVKKELGARFININPENALEKTNKKFIKRFKYLEEKAKKNGKALQDMTLAEMDVYWNEAKKK